MAPTLHPWATCHCMQVLDKMLGHIMAGLERGGAAAGLTSVRFDAARTLNVVLSSSTVVSM